MTTEYKKYLAFLLIVAAIVLAAGLGLRDPWPADEPRFALIARDMAESGQWLFPRIGGVLYPDKPPLFFWLVAALYSVTGSIQVSFLLPGLFAGLAILVLVTDLGRRLWGERTAIWCGAVLLALIQFPLQMKSGQIDGVLCLMTTASLYGLTRHLLLGPDWRSYALGGLFAGLGVITKGVGFLPFLVLVPYVFAAMNGWPVFRHSWRDSRWLLAPAAFLLPIVLWLVPMLIAASNGAEFAEYRDNILFHQTVTRYANAWGHIKPPWYLLTNAVPWLWLPASLLLPWLAPAWWRDLRDRQASVLLLGAWVLLVLLFFSLSSGKRSVYILPAAPAFALLVGYHAEQLFRRVGVRRLFALLPAVIAVAMIGAAVYALMNPHDFDRWIIDVVVLLKLSAAMFAMGALMLFVVLLCRQRRVLTGYGGAMIALWLGLSLLVAPVLDGTRSGANLISNVKEKVRDRDAVGFVAWPEQFLLQWNGPAYHFGFRRDPDGEIRDAISWLSQSGRRSVLLPEQLMETCFDRSLSTFAGTAHRRDWMLVDRVAVLESCSTRGSSPQHVVHYVPPNASPGEYVLHVDAAEVSRSGASILGQSVPRRSGGG
jgi:4-amino-4-deoxy-L-arabinose transferase-like glycosyltransferase